MYTNHISYTRVFSPTPHPTSLYYAANMSTNQIKQSRRTLPMVNWAELWLAKKQIIPFGSKSSCWRKLFTLLDVGSFLKIPRVVGKSSAPPVGLFSMLPNPPKCHMRQNKNCNFHNKIEHPLELRLASQSTLAAATTRNDPLMSGLPSCTPACAKFCLDPPPTKII